MVFSLDDALQVAEAAARSAGKILRDMLNTAAVKEKAPKDLVTDADVAAQWEIERQLMKSYSEHGFLGEESEGDWSHFQRSHRWTWVVDPLDGTANYVHRLPNFAVSIALSCGSRVALGVVYDPMSDECYTALEGGGAYLNGNRIRATDCIKLEEALVAVSFPPQVNRESPEVFQFLNVLERSQSVRRLGSAALNLCYVGHGRLDAYWANRLKPWDIAAGSLIAAEAGAQLMGGAGDPFDFWRGEVVAAATAELHRELQECLR